MDFYNKHTHVPVGFMMALKSSWPSIDLEMSIKAEKNKSDHFHIHSFNLNQK